MLLSEQYWCQALALGAMTVAARTISSVRVLAVLAPFDTSAQHRRPAGLDGLHQAMLMQGQGMCLPVGGAVLSKDVGQLQGWLGHQPFFRTLTLGGLALSRLEQLIQRTGRSADCGRRNGRVTCGSFDTAVTEQCLDDAGVDPT